MLKIGVSPCPNDTFIFFAFIEKKIDTKGLDFEFIIEDVESLNNLCLKNSLDISKVSAHAFYYLQNSYEVLSSGGAISECGPVVITKDPERLKSISKIKVALPGRLTTASALMWFYWRREFSQKDYILEFMPFYEIIDKVFEEKVDIGVLIHEGRLTYSLKNLHLVVDLGKFWIKETYLPVPLGCIVAKRSLEIKKTLEEIIKKSLNYAYCNFDEALNFVKKFSQELDENVIKSHIQCYVNKFSFDMTNIGFKSIMELTKRIDKEAVWY